MFLDPCSRWFRGFIGPSKRTCASPPSPDGDGDRPCQRRDHKAEVHPAPISLSGPGKHKKMEHDPQTHRDSQHEPNQIAGVS